MQLKSFGCSFIYGSDLIDANNAWPALLATQLGYGFKCYARPGSGNLQIAERVLNQIANSNNSDLFVIGWTWIDRFDYNDISKADSWETIRPVDETAVATTYYRDLHSEYRDKLTSLMTIKFTIDTLTQNNIPFIMTYMDDLLFDQRWHTSNSIEYLQMYVKPYMTTFEGQTFLNWSRSNGYPIGLGGHPIETAHLSAGDYMIKRFDKEISHH